MALYSAWAYNPRQYAYEVEGKASLRSCAGYSAACMMQFWLITWLCLTTQVRCNCILLHLPIELHCSIANMCVREAHRVLCFEHLNVTFTFSDGRGIETVGSQCALQIPEHACDYRKHFQRKLLQEEGERDRMKACPKYRSVSAVVL